MLPNNFRWRIVLLLFLVTTINYIDRNVLSFAMLDDTFRKEMLGVPLTYTLTQADLNDFKIQYGWIDTTFKIAYALGFMMIGWFIDRVGTKRGLAASIGLWSMAGIANAFVGSFRGLAVTRFMLGFGEAGNFPSSIKSIAEWFPKKERAFATGIFNAGTNVGIILTAAVIPWMTLHYGWRISFMTTGVLGLAVLAIWWMNYQRPEKHANVSPVELRYIQQDHQQEEVAGRLTWWRLLRYRQTWALIVGKFMADPIWWFYLTWLPDFFNSSESLDQTLDLQNIGLPFMVIYIISDGGSVFFGWLSSQFMKQGWDINRARKTTMLLCALCVVPIFFAAQTHNIYIAVVLIAFAAAGHLGWSANVYTFASDLFPKSAVAMVTGLGGFAGAVGGAILAAIAGPVRVQFGYLPLFLVAGSTYLIALLIINVLVPKMKPVEM
ncbi:MFS transporter [Runella slithyformis]|uniref:Major facilitator superfamily MFS_1 n=1 Tax=Runella slithyformis (strain ATCC 29530 / DSM 19594 / LMG 11500 / NCIMB 11436 / LSU 4) TaxID=761193 RepID=A0A7U4E581_RUNSL|nr:MFS transporter [Runella slithyformis]AEI48296.1 major facilitator superfamily MFS_1 [Runella slithyformis DSM 19594]